MQVDIHGKKIRPDFSWGKALTHCGMALLAVVVFGGLAAATLDVADPQRFGEGLGRFTFFILLGVLAMSWASQTGRKGVSIGAGLLVAGLFITAFAVVFLGLQLEDKKLTAEERQPLLVTGDGAHKRFKHPHLGFSLKHPGPGYEPMTEAMLSQFSGSSIPKDEYQVYGYTNMTEGNVLVVFLFKGMDTRQALEEFMKGVTGAAAKEPGSKITRNHVEWNHGKGRADFAMELKNGMYHLVLHAALKPMGPDDVTFAVCVMTGSPTLAWAKGIVESFVAN